jgi:hypothetical protein
MQKNKSIINKTLILKKTLTNFDNGKVFYKKTNNFLVKIQQLPS